MPQSRDVARIAGATAIALSLLPAGAALADVSSEALVVQSRGDVRDGATVPVATKDVLTPGATYEGTVVGTFSPWAYQLYSDYPDRFASCGSPESGPIFATDGVHNGPVSNDAAFQFGAPQPGGCGDRTYPNRLSAVVVSTGGSFVAPTYDGLGAAPSANHFYRFTVTGAGKPFAARLADVYAGDNYGVLSLVITKRGATPVTPTLTPTPNAQAPLVTSSSVNNGGSVNGSSNGQVKGVSKRVCASRRTLTVHVRSSQVKSITARLTGTGVSRALKVRIGKTKASIPVDLKSLAKSRYTVTVTINLKSGRTYSDVRRYRTCTRKMVSKKSKSAK